ncbi:hypothetical protein FNB79_01050 [Formosa sediminum]|uniref:Phosphoribosylpyrophosphate synthetase n=1 Tax=Formosa sediminum TaxID=2594004 RepID=A0A516GM69_9FLAO|nr:hypothetical protein [Formosa sediminum]QDO92626.1 hypothetical protein FNB79_01050 [Formosa sediminum]
MIKSDEYAKHESDFIKQYQNKGYRANYQIVDGALIDLETKEKFKPEQVKVVAEHRYEGMSNPSDMSILYVLETPTASKGTFLTGFGPSANLEDAEFFKTIPDANYSENSNILKDE